VQEGKASRTARAAATHRPAHQIFEQGRIFRDPLALRILGESRETVERPVLSKRHDKEWLVEFPGHPLRVQ
jgi:hypothetical protein